MEDRPLYCNLRPFLLLPGWSCSRLVSWPYLSWKVLTSLMWVCNSVLFWRVKSRSNLTSLISVPNRQCFREPGDVKIRLGLNVYCLKVFPWLISEHWRSLRQSGGCLFWQAVGCPYIHWVSWLWVVSCGLHNRTFSLLLLSLSFFPQK